MKYIQITRSDVTGNYIEKRENIIAAVEGELDNIDYMDMGTQIILTIVDMEQQDFEKLPEFLGW